MNIWISILFENHLQLSTQIRFWIFCMRKSSYNTKKSWNADLRRAAFTQQQNNIGQGRVRFAATAVFSSSASCCEFCFKHHNDPHRILLIPIYCYWDASWCCCWLSSQMVFLFFVLLLLAQTHIAPEKFDWCWKQNRTERKIHPKQKICKPQGIEAPTETRSREKYFENFSSIWRYSHIFSSLCFGIPRRDCELSWVVWFTRRVSEKSQKHIWCSCGSYATKCRVWVNGY